MVTELVHPRHLSIKHWNSSQDRKPRSNSSNTQVEWRDKRVYLSSIDVANTGWNLPEPKDGFERDLAYLRKQTWRQKMKTEDEDEAIDLETNKSWSRGGCSSVNSLVPSYYLVNCWYKSVYERVMSLVSALLNSPNRRKGEATCHDGRKQGPHVTGMSTCDFWAICTCLMRLMCCLPTWLLPSAPNCHNSRLLQRIAIAFRLFCSHVFCARSLQTLSIAIPPRSMLS